MDDIHSKRMIRRYGHKNCKFCHQRIRPSIVNYSIRKFCSQTCYDEYKREQRLKFNTNKNNKLITSCVVCKTIIETTKSARKKYCSKKCQDTVIKQRLLNTSFQQRRFFILQRDNFSCVLCGASSFSDGVKLHIDHIIPKNNTGLKIEDELPERLMTLCEACNLSKAKNLLDDSLISKIIERNKEKTRRF